MLQKWKRVLVQTGENWQIKHFPLYHLFGGVPIWWIFTYAVLDYFFCNDYIPSLRSKLIAGSMSWFLGYSIGLIFVLLHMLD